MGHCKLNADFQNPSNLRYAFFKALAFDLEKECSTVTTRWGHRGSNAGPSECSGGIS